MTDAPPVPTPLDEALKQKVLDAFRANRDRAHIKVGCLIERWTDEPEQLKYVLFRFGVAGSKNAFSPTLVCCAHYSLQQIDLSTGWRGVFTHIEVPIETKPDEYTTYTIQLPQDFFT